jgi:hypothetical protein
MNYIKQLQAGKAEALDSARSIETEINDLASNPCRDKFRVDTTRTSRRRARPLLPIRNTVTQFNLNLYKSTTNDKNK